MSDLGKLQRGMKWFQFRDIDGNLPSDVLIDPNKMSDVNFYLEFCESKNMKIVNECLETIRYLQRNAVKGGEERLQAEKNKLFSLGQEAVKEVKEEPTKSKRGK